MINKYKKFLVLTCLVLGLFLVLPMAKARTKTTAQKSALNGLNTTAGLYGGQDAFGGIKEPAQIIGIVIGVALSFIGVVFFALLVYGGFNWMIARGNEEEVKKSIDLIQQAVFGLIIVLAAYAVADFLTKAFVK